MNFRILFFTVLGLFISTQALAWGNDGHSIVGYIAEKNLTPAAQTMLQDVIGLEPMPLTAIWADLVREDARFKKFTAYHFFETPVQEVVNGVSIETHPERDARTLIEQGPERVLNTLTSRPEKIIWLRYLIHVVGDIHQPLHVGSGIDLGGNLCLVNWQRPGSSRLEETNLHSLWDTKLSYIAGEEYKLESARTASIKQPLDFTEIAERITKEFGSEITMSSAAKDSKEEWYESSRTLQLNVYPDEKPVKSSVERPYCRIIDAQTRRVVNGKFSSSKVPTISKAYLSKALPIVKKQLLLAGYRLAGMLNSMGEKYVSSGPKGIKEFNISEIGLFNKDLRLPQSDSKLRKFIEADFANCDHDHN